MTQIYMDVQCAATHIKSLVPAWFTPKIGIILGTGLGKLADNTEIISKFPYSEIPGFPSSTVASHAGRLICGKLGGEHVIIQQGRWHVYEGYEPHQTVMGVRAMSLLGVDTLIVSNSSGALNPRFEAGDLMLITDHINMTGRSPLQGSNVEEFGPRFPDMSQPYDQNLGNAALKAAQKLGIRLEKGVYIGICGPQMETPAETRFYRMAGADAIGMSTVLEVIAARHAGLRVLGISCLANKNLPDCMAEAPLEEIISMCEASSQKLSDLITEVVRCK